MPEKRGKILVIRGGAIGDFILTLPAIAALRRTFPETHLEVLGYPQMAQLAQAAGIIDSFRSIEARALAGFFARTGNVDPELASHFESFNLVISYLYDPDDFFKINVGRCTNAQFLQGPHRPSEDQPIHATEVFLKPLEQLAIFDADPVPRLALTKGGVLEGGEWVAAHPGSGSEKKNWPLDKWQQFIDSFLDETDWNLLLVGGEADGERLEQLRYSGPRVRSIRNLPLLEVAQFMAGCTGFIGHDSGITHLAAALGLPALVLWGPSKEEIWRPISPSTRVLKASGGLDELSVGTVVAQFKDLLKAGPCE